MVLLEGKMTGAGAVLQMDMIGFSCSCYYNLRQSQRMILVHVFNEFFKTAGVLMPFTCTASYALLVNDWHVTHYCVVRAYLWRSHGYDLALKNRSVLS